MPLPPFSALPDYLGQDVVSASNYQLYYITQQHRKYVSKNFFLDFFVCLQYQCCGIINQKDYDESKWKEQALGGDDLNYPLTCCVLNNPSDPQNYLNPMPKNKENCMNTSHQSKYRLDRYQPVSSSIHISYTTSGQK